MYDILYDFIINNIFNSTALSSYTSEIMGVSTNMNVWLSHTLTIILMCLFVFALYLFGKFLFKVVSGLFLLR